MTLLAALLSSFLLFAFACQACYAVSVQPGWPQATYAAVHSSAALGDLDGDGQLEVVIGADDHTVRAWHADGSPVAGWPRFLTEMVCSSPVLGDLQNDGLLEVIIGGDSGLVEAWYPDGTPSPGWPQDAGGMVRSSPALGDLDGDGDLEVVVGSGDAQVYAWHHDGSRVAGWPCRTSGYVAGSPALGDIDGDGGPEVVIAPQDRYLYAWHHDGSPLVGWPQVSETPIDSSPALGDLDGDGKLEVAIGSEGGRIYAWHSDGSLVQGWPQTTDLWVKGPPALGDLDNDGQLELVVGSGDYRVYAWRHDGSPMAGWPRTTGGQIWGSPALGDLDGDKNLEVLIGSHDGNTYAWHHDGSLVSGWPQSTGQLIESSPALEDLEGDGDLEVVIGCAYRVYAWSCETPTTDLSPWPMFRHDPLHTGRYGGAVVTPGAYFIASPVIGPVPLNVAFTDQSTDAPTSWAWDFGDGTTSTAQHPAHEYTAVGRYPVSLSVVTDLGPASLTKARCMLVLFPDVLTDQWAWRQVIACVEAGIVGGYPGSTYLPTLPVSREQMAVFISRALAGGDSFVPTGPPTATFPDVPTDHWAFKYVEYAAAEGVVGGYWDGSYRPTLTVTRDQMAVFVARAMCGGDSSVPSGPATASFPDVPTDHWAFRCVEYIRGEGVTGGYPDGTYRPALAVNRDQMAVYVQRAFALPL